MRLTHLSADGTARMVDVGAKAATRREAVAAGRVTLPRETLRLLKDGKLPKGDAFAAARIAGILAAKKVDQLIPLCHTLPLDSVSVDFSFEPGGVLVRARAALTGKTGVEMEALTAVSVAALTLYDMCKSAGPGIELGPIYLEKKTGGKADYVRPAGA
jgi:cyclic pyranopterin monophosphate synthase